MTQNIASVKPIDYDAAVTVLASLDKRLSRSLAKASIPMLPWLAMRNYDPEPFEMWGNIRDNLLLKDHLVLNKNDGIWLDCGVSDIGGHETYSCMWIRREDSTISLSPFLSASLDGKHALGVPYFKAVLSLKSPPEDSIPLSIAYDSMRFYAAALVTKAWNYEKKNYGQLFPSIVLKDVGGMLETLNAAIRFLSFATDVPPLVINLDSP